MKLFLSRSRFFFCGKTAYLKRRVVENTETKRLKSNVPQGPIAIGGGTPLNIARYKRSVSSILWVQLALVVCYVPFGIALMLSAKGINFVAWSATETLVYLNSSLNPVLYCWKMREVKQAVGDTIRQLYCF